MDVDNLANCASRIRMVLTKREVRSMFACMLPPTVVQTHSVKKPGFCQQSYAYLSALFLSIDDQKMHHLSYQEHI